MPSFRLDPDDLEHFDCYVPDFISLVCGLEDPRVRGRTQHALSTVLFVCLSASLSGVKSIYGFGVFAQSAWPWIRSCLGDQIGAEPLSHDTIGRVLQRFKPEFLDELLVRASKRFVKPPPDDSDELNHLALDGKRLRGTAQNALQHRPIAAGGQQPAVSVNLFSVDSGLVVASHTPIDSCSEHAGLRRVLEGLDLRGALVSADAGNSFPHIADLIASRSGDWLLCVKGNNSATQELCRQAFGTQAERDYRVLAQAPDVRGDWRRVRVTTLDRALADGPGRGACDEKLLSQWPGAKCVVEVERRRKDRATEAAFGERMVRGGIRVYYVCSVDLSAAEAMKYIRSHWHVENKLHWGLDVNYGEDASRARTGFLAMNLASIRRIANNMLAAVTKRASRQNDQIRFAHDLAWRAQVWGMV